MRRVLCAQLNPPHSFEKGVPISRRCHAVLRLAKNGWLEMSGTGVGELLFEGAPSEDSGEVLTRIGPVWLRSEIQ